MTDLMMIAVTALLAAAAVGLGGWVWRRHSRWLHRAERARMIVHTTNGDTFDGLVVQAAADGVYLAPATAVVGSNRHDLEGGAFVPAAQVAWCQRPPAPDDT